MIREELYHRTVDILVKAYVDGYLNPMDCAACACGNLVAANNGYKVNRYFWTDSNDNIVEPSWKTYGGLESENVQTLSTGYTPLQLRKIETSFMWGKDNAPLYNNSLYSGRELPENCDEDIFNRLMDVIDTLDEIHEVQDTKVNTDSKARFVKA